MSAKATQQRPAAHASADGAICVEQTHRPLQRVAHLHESFRKAEVVPTHGVAPQLIDFGTHPYLTVGRAEPADVCVSDAGVSRLHVRLSRESVLEQTMHEMRNRKVQLRLSLQKTASTRSRERCFLP